MLLRTVLRAASAWMIWRWLEPRWRSTLALVIGWLTVVLLHNEYVEYVQITQSIEQLWLSYVLKWIVILLGISAWIWFSFLGTRAPKATLKSAANADKPSSASSGKNAAVDDGFDFLRHKIALESRGDKVLQNQAGGKQARRLPYENAGNDDKQAPP